VIIIGLSIGLLATLLALAVQLEALSGAPSEIQTWMVVALYGLAGALFSGAIASFYALMTHAYPPSCRSAGIGFGIFVGRVGAIGATGLGGVLIDIGHGSLVPFFAVLCVSAVLILAAALVNDRHVPAAARKAAPA
jgi:AAHS family 4-hydroxybenzoate transporter-like MFS transporter